MQSSPMRKGQLRLPDSIVRLEHVVIPGIPGFHKCYVEFPIVPPPQGCLVVWEENGKEIWNFALIALPRDAPVSAEIREHAYYVALGIINAAYKPVMKRLFSEVLQALAEGSRQDWPFCYGETDSLVHGIRSFLADHIVGTVHSVTTPYNEETGEGGVTTTAMQWNNIGIGSFGVLPGSTAPVLDGTSVTVAQAAVWRGRRIDPTGLYYMGARYYEPLSGRFISPDPLGHASSMSLYDYANGDPVNGLDPTGRCVETAGRLLYAGVAGTMNTGISIAASPLIFVEGAVSGIIGGDYMRPIETVAYSVGAGLKSYERSFEAAQQTNLGGVAQLLGYQIPVLGSFLPGETGNTSGNPFTIFSRGIAGKSADLVTQGDEASLRGLGYSPGFDSASAPYARGSAIEVLSELFLGNTSRGLEYADQVSSIVGNGATIDQIGHSGGVERSLLGSKYLGYYGIGVNANASQQGPAIGYFNNVSYLALNYSPHANFVGEPTSTFGDFLSPAVFSERGTQVNAIWNQGSHWQTGNGSEWDTTVMFGFRQW